MSKDFLPKVLVLLCAWCENMMMEFPEVASSLGFTPAEITAFLADLQWVIYDCKSGKDAQTYASAWVQFRENHFYGDSGTVVGVLPGTMAPTAPAGVPRPNGLIPRIRLFCGRIRKSPTFTTSIGETLKLNPPQAVVDDANAKPDTRAKPLSDYRVELRCKRLFEAVRTRMRRDGEANAKDLGLSVGTRIIDNTPLAEPGKPENRTYEQIYMRNNEPVGLWSDSVRVTVQP